MVKVGFRKPVLSVLAVAALAGAGACGSGNAAADKGTTAAPTTSTTAVATTTTTTTVGSPAGARAVIFTDADRDRHVSVPIGRTVWIRVHPHYRPVRNYTLTGRQVFAFLPIPAPRPGEVVLGAVAQHLGTTIFSVPYDITRLCARTAPNCRRWKLTITVVAKS